MSEKGISIDSCRSWQEVEAMTSMERKLDNFRTRVQHLSKLGRQDLLFKEEEKLKEAVNSGLTFPAVLHRKQVRMLEMALRSMPF